MLKTFFLKVLDCIIKFFPELRLKKKMMEIINHTPSLVSRMRQKDKIKVLFVLSCLPKWKTESLYLSMLDNPRFDPLIGVALMTVDYPAESVSKYIQLTEYLRNKDYCFIELHSPSDFETINPDIVFHQEASGGGILKSLMFDNYTKCLYCYITYGLFIPSDIKLINTPYHNVCWKVFFESPLLVDYARRTMDNKGRNTVFTGVPMTDLLLMDKALFVDPWRVSSCKKRVIWAPHHSILDQDHLHYGTFLIYADAMLELAKKYKGGVQWAFKPHPVLKGKLIKLWGKEKTNDYYRRWIEMDNTQLEEGDYVSLFKYSDALIHDCGSFMVEYLYMTKPCMFLEKKKISNLNPFGQKCYEQYYIGHNIDEVESFIVNIISGIDSFHETRAKFVRDYLLPPNNRTASENIINSILGECEYLVS